MTRAQMIECIVAAFVACAGLTSVVVRHFDKGPAPVVHVTKPIPGMTAQAEYVEPPLFYFNGDGEPTTINNAAGF